MALNKSMKSEYTALCGKAGELLAYSRELHADVHKISERTTVERLCMLHDKAQDLADQAAIMAAKIAIKRGEIRESTKE